MSAGALGSLGIESFLEMELQGVLSFPVWVLGTKLWSPCKSSKYLLQQNDVPTQLLCVCNVWTPTHAEVTVKLYSPFSPSTFMWGTSLHSRSFPTPLLRARAARNPSRLDLYSGASTCP